MATITITNGNAQIVFDYNTIPAKKETVNKNTDTFSLFGDYVTVHRPNNPSGDINFKYTDIVGATSADNLLTTLLGYANVTGYVSQVFISTAGQTTFTPAFTCTSGSTYVTIGGIATVSGWSIVGGAVVFSVGQLIGTEVVISLM